MTYTRVDRDADALPQSSSVSLFGIFNGRVLLRGLLGEVTVEVATVSTDQISLLYVPDSWSLTQLGTVPISAGPVPVGAYLSLETRGSPSLNSQLREVDGSRYSFPLSVDHLMLEIGTIDLACTASRLGQIKWTLLYEPFDINATVAAI